MTKVQADYLGQQPQSRSHAVARLLTRRERERIADRIRELDELATLVRERPFSGRWAA